MGDMNGKEDRDRIDDVMGTYGMHGMNYNARELIDMCNVYV